MRMPPNVRNNPLPQVYLLKGGGSISSPRGDREILGEIRLNSDIVVVFYMGVGGFLHLPGC
jgi:hypothetical protein